MNQIPNIEEKIKAIRPKLLPTTAEMDLYEREVIKEVHHQLQEARQDWIREEIVRLEGMYIVSKPELDFVNTHIKTWEQGYNHGISEIIDRYQAELDHQPDRPLNVERD